jgi:DNA-binding transcriptional ArsR family regulator
VQNNPLCLCHLKVFTRFWIGLQARFVCLVSGQTVECYQSPSHIVRAFMGKEVSDQMSPTAGDDTPPVFRVLFEVIPLKRIDLVSNYTGNFHRCSPIGRHWIFIAHAQRNAGSQHTSDRLAPRDFDGISFVVFPNALHTSIMPLAEHRYFVYDHIVDVTPHTDVAVSGIAAAIGEPARARMLYCLMDGHARTSTELAAVAEVTPSTASAHLNRLKAARLVKQLVQGKHRFYSLYGPDVASALEGLSVLAGGSRDQFMPTTPTRLRAARTCYDHMAGAVGVSIHDRFFELRWLSTESADDNCGPADREPDSTAYALTPRGAKSFEGLGIDVDACRQLRRRFACACLDWSERRPHLGGALGAALLQMALKRKWLVQHLDSRALDVTSFGRREILTRFGLRV